MANYVCMYVCDQNVIINNYLLSFKLTPRPSDIIYLCQRFFQSSKHFWNVLFGIANSSSFDYSFISSIVVKHFPFIGVFSFGKRKKSAGSKSGEYGGFGIIMFLVLAKTSRTSIIVWGAKSTTWYSTILGVSDELLRAIGA